MKETEAILISSLFGKAFLYEPVRQQSNRHQDPFCYGNDFLFYPPLSSQPDLPNRRLPEILHIRSSLISRLQVGSSGAHQLEFSTSVPFVPMVADQGIISD